VVQNLIKKKGIFVSYINRVFFFLFARKGEEGKGKKEREKWVNRYQLLGPFAFLPPMMISLAYSIMNNIAIRVNFIAPR